MRLEVPRRADDIPVVVVRITLRFHKRLAAAIRARIEVRVARGAAIKRRDQSFRRHGHEMLRAVQVILRALRMADGPVGIGGNVACVGRRGCVPAPDDLVQAAIESAPRVVERADITAFTRREETSVPLRR